MSDRVLIEDGRLRYADRAVPLVAGEIQFWRMPPETWPAAIAAARGVGVTMVSTYLSWRRHEVEPGSFDLTGDTDPRLDLPAFLRLCAEQDLAVQLKPGPWICAEEPGGGYPDRLLETADLIARDDRGDPVIGYNPPFLHPVPSYPNPDYLAEVRKWFAAVWGVLRPYAHPRGPVVAIQLDNEPSSCFQDSMYGADYSDHSIRAFRRWLVREYPGGVTQLADAWGRNVASFDVAEPPRRPAVGATSSRPHLHDWIRFKTDATADYLLALRRMHEQLGGGGLLFTVNLVTHPVHDVPVSHRTIRTATGAAVGEDHYYVPPLRTDDLARLARSAATARAAGESLPWIPELQAGIWRSPGERVDYPDPTPLEQEVWTGAAVALGFAGANFYMLSDRENWADAPIDARGSVTPFVSAVEILTRLAASAPDLLAATPDASVHVAWHRPDAYDAYAVTGTARVPRTGWHDDRAAAAYQAWTELLDRLTELGITYELWDTATTFDEDDAATVLVPAYCTVPEQRLRSLRGAGHTVHRLDPRVDDVPAQPSGHLVVDGSPLEKTLVTTRTSRDHELICVVHWGRYEGPAEVVMTGRRARRLPLDHVCPGFQAILIPREDR